MFIGWLANVWVLGSIDVLDTRDEFWRILTRYVTSKVAITENLGYFFFRVSISRLDLGVSNDDGVCYQW